MNRSASRVRNLAILAASCMALSGCVVTPAPYGYGETYYGPAVTVAPPAPQAEYYGAPPAAGYIWIGGYWNWVGGRYAWVGGHWEAPRRGYHWEPRRWTRGRDGWRMSGGRWVRG